MSIAEAQTSPGAERSTRNEFCCYGPTPQLPGDFGLSGGGKSGNSCFRDPQESGGTCVPRREGLSQSHRSESSKARPFLRTLPGGHDSLSSSF